MKDDHGQFKVDSCGWLELNVNCVSLASFLTPSPNSKLADLEQWQAKDFLKKYAPERDDHPQLDRPTAALGSEENIYSLGNCNLERMQSKVQPLV